jgi:CHAT domain-containing protein
VWLPLLAYRDDSVRQRIDGYALAFGRWREAPADERRRKAFFDTIDALTRWLWDAVMKPLLDAIAPASEAVLVPGGLLGLLPIHAAWTDDATAPTRRRYALDVASLRFTPCASALMAAARIAERTAADSVLAVAEPRPVHAGPLPSAEQEVEAVISCFAAHTVLRHEQATKAAVLAEFARHPLQHFCCHGGADFVEPLNGGLLMAADQCLSLRDLLGLRSPGIRLAVLSACETGIPGLELPDEVISLPAGWLQAGAAGVVASLWSVADASTMILMARFYRLWRAQNQDIAQAFREAQQWVRDSTNGEKAEFLRSLPRYPDADRINATKTSVLELMALSDPAARGFAHPFYWAAFSYTGV